MPILLKLFTDLLLALEGIVTPHPRPSVSGMSDLLSESEQLIKHE